MKNPLFTDGHLSCSNCRKEPNAYIEMIEKRAGDTIEKEFTGNQMFFVIDGVFTLIHAKYPDVEVTKDKIMLFPVGSRAKMNISCHTRLIVCKIGDVTQLCNCKPIERLYEENGKLHKEEFRMLDANEHIQLYTDSLIKYFEYKGLKCFCFFKIKQKELFFLLKTYYPKDELARFFSPLLCKDSQFMNLVYKNYRYVKSVHELAEMSAYSLSGFKKHFCRTFGVPASEWISNQKSMLIFKDLNDPTLSIKEIADKYEFASVSSFSTFCVHKFGIPPGKIRKNNTEF